MAFSVDGPSSIAAPQALPADPADVPAWVRPVRLPADAGRCTRHVQRPAAPVVPAAVPAWVRVQDLALALALGSVPVWAVRDWLRRLQAKRLAPSVLVLPVAAAASSIPR